jgi:hypothetical protein
MKVFEHRTFTRFDDRDSAARFSDIEFRQCCFQDCKLSITHTPALRSVIHASLIDCSVNAGSIGTAIVQNVTVDRLKIAGLFQTFGTVFNQVTLRGAIDRLMITNDALPSLFLDENSRRDEVETFRVANGEYYRQGRVALDISQAEFKEFDIRGVPVHLIRRDPETQMVLTREGALKGGWRQLALRETLWTTWIEQFLQSDEVATILVAPKRHAKYRNYLEDLFILREAGVVESD